MPYLFINDGQNYQRDIEFGPWPKFRVVYRQALPDRHADYSIEFNNAVRGSDRVGAILNLLLGPKDPNTQQRSGPTLVSWNLYDRQGKNVMVNEEYLRLVPLPLLMELVNTVTGLVEKQEVYVEETGKFPDGGAAAAHAPGLGQGQVR